MTKPDTTQPLIADEIRAARDAARLTRKELAAEVGVTVDTIKNWETGKTTPSAHHREMCQAVLGRMQSLAIPARGPALPDESESWRLIRERAGMTQQQMGYVMGVPAATIAEWERPKMFPNLSQRARYQSMAAQLDAES